MTNRSRRTCRSVPATATRVRARTFVVAMALAGSAGVAAAASDDSVRCIVGDNAIGCADEAALIRLIDRTDAGTLRRRLQQKLDSGQCRLFAYGERVLAGTAHDARVQVHGPGERAAWWMPASWSVPATACAETPNVAALQRKLGLEAPALPIDEQGRRGLADERGSTSRDWNDDDDSEYRDGDADGEDQRWQRRRRPPPGPTRPLPSSRYAHACDARSHRADAEPYCSGPRR
jgi:hypothetical protein